MPVPAAAPGTVGDHVSNLRLPPPFPCLSPPQVDTNKFYELLGVEKSASKGEIRKAFMKLARKVCVCE